MSFLFKIGLRIPPIKKIILALDRVIYERDMITAERDMITAERDLLLREKNHLLQRIPTIAFDPSPRYDSVDETPWKHPYLTPDNIRRFRIYSEAIWQYAMEFDGGRNPSSLKLAFCTNMNQSMHKWSMLSKKYGADATLFLNPLDKTILMSPEWELFDGEFADLENEQEFLKIKENIPLEVPCRTVQMDGFNFLTGYARLLKGDRLGFIKIMDRAKSVRPESLAWYTGFYPYFEWSCELAKYDMIYSMDPIGAVYASGRPYCIFAYGGDLMWVCGRSDELGLVAHLGYNAARFLLASNPHVLAQCRRLGLSNALYLPYPMDDHRYCPGPGTARKEWVREHGDGVYILMTSRWDTKWKGQDTGFFDILVKAAKERNNIRYVVINWGDDANTLRSMIESNGIQDQFLLLNPVGKKKLIDYYRSCDIFMDQFFMGYYGATALEAASVGKPIIMKLREDQYNSLYKGDAIPAMNADSPAQIYRHICALVDHADLRLGKEKEMREWLVRNHGEEKTMPLMLALFGLVASGRALPEEISRLNPLMDDQSEEEMEYHRNCLVEAR